MTAPLLALVRDALADQYAIDSEIGRGGMAVVYRARDLRLERDVAIKVLPPELAYDPAIRTRFVREARTSAGLAHPHIVPIHDVGERNGIAWFVMGLVGAGNLGALLAREPRQPLDEVRRMLGEVAEALAYAHQRGVIHRDVKPDNILLDGDTGRTYVTDFGIARAVESNTRLTVTGNAVGTPTYMSPEQAVGEREVDGRSDIYSLGIVGYQMLTGRVPFAAGNSLALLLKQVSERPAPIEAYRPDAPRQLREAIERALEKAPDDRWPTAQSFRDALREEQALVPGWRSEPREPVRYDSPHPASRRAVGNASPRRGVPAADPRLARPAGRAHAVEPARAGGAGRLSVASAARSGSPDAGASEAAVGPTGIVMEAPHLTVLTDAEREDLRLWHGRVNLFDRVKAARWYGLTTAVLVLGGIPASIAALVAGGVPPVGLIPIVYMSRKLWRRGKSLRAAGLKLRRVFLMPRAKSVLPGPPKAPSERELVKLAGRELLDGPQAGAIRRAAADRAAILGIFGTLGKPDRALLPDVKPTADGLLERVVGLAKALARLDGSFDPREYEELERRLAEADGEPPSLEAERRISLLRRQRATLQDLADTQATLRRQIESACLALGNLRLDLIRFRSTGLQSALGEVSGATRDARALSRDIEVALAAVEQVRGS